MSEQIRAMADICSQLKITGTVREACHTGLSLIKERLHHERVSIVLNKSYKDHEGLFFGFFALNQPVETQEQLSEFKKTLPEVCGQTAIVAESADVLDFQGKKAGQADRLCVPILTSEEGTLGYLVADNLLDQTPWDDASIELFRVFAIFLANLLVMKASESRQKRDALQMRTLIDSLPAYIYVKDAQSRFLVVNQKQVKETGANSPEEMLGKTDFDYYPKKLAQKFYDDEQALMRSGKPLVNIEEECRNRSGEAVWLLTTKIPLKDEHGVVFSLVGIGLDITEQKKYQQQIKESEACYRTLFGNISDAILVHDEDGCILDCNDAAPRLFECALEDLAGKSVASLNLPGYLDFLKTKSAENESFVETLKTRQGGDLCVDIKASSINYRGVSAKLVLLRDVTELVEARKRAEHAAKAKSAFLANMSHEIRTPLNAVIGMTTLLADSGMSDEQRDFVQIIQTSGEALLTLINDILDLSKIEAGALKLEEVPFNLRRCVESSLDIVSGKAFEKGLELACCVNGDVPQILIGDSARLRQVLLNLMNNAIKFTEAGEVVIRVAGIPLLEQKHRLDFSVTDTGIGMTEETAQRIFTPFEQADSSTTRKYGGTGLGLSICNRLVEMMGGSLHVKSSVGHGSEFSFNIVLRRTLDESSAQDRINQDVLKGKRVLIVDDNMTSLQILEYQLKQWDVIPLMFSKGADVLKHLGSLGRIDFAILDMMMPEMDGEMLAQALRARPEFMNRPILILSSTGNASIVENPSANAWLTKPAKPDRLLEKLALLLESSETEKLSHVEKADTAIRHTLGLTHPLRILVAEDNAVNQKVALKLLSRLGYEADLASNGLESVEAVKNKTYDLVLMDIQMPLMNGLEATEKILKLYPDGNRPSVVAMTAHALKESVQEGMDCGMSGYIVKPIRFEELIATLEKTPRRNV